MCVITWSFYCASHIANVGLRVRDFMLGDLTVACKCAWQVRIERSQGGNGQLYVENGIWEGAVSYILQDLVSHRQQPNNSRTTANILLGPYYDCHAVVSEHQILNITRDVNSADFTRDVNRRVVCPTINSCSPWRASLLSRVKLTTQSPAWREVIAHIRQPCTATCTPVPGLMA